MKYPHLIVDHQKNGITAITLDRPEKRNALNREMMESLCSAFRDASEQRVIVLKGNGKGFSSGLDLEENLDTRTAEKVAPVIATLFQTVRCSPLVTIAAAHGPAIAGGAALVAACDYAIGTTELQLGFPEVKRGLVAALASTLLVRKIPESYIRELLVFGNLVDGKRAQEMGLIHQLVSLDELDAVAMQAAKSVLECSPSAIAETKRLLEKLRPAKIEHDVAEALIIHKQARMHLEAQEGISAFLEKRPPNWSSQ